MVFFDSVEEVGDDPILGLVKAFKQDPREKKVNLGVGVYRNAEGKPHVLSSVRKAEEMIFAQHLDKEYPAIDGNTTFVEEILKLIFGSNNHQHIYGAQTVGATGALRVGGEFLLHNKISDTIYLSDPTWPNHRAIFKHAGMKIDTYPYYDDLHHNFNFPAMCEAIKTMPPGSTILMQPCCHNPTGIGPSIEQWKELSSLIKNQQLIPFFDFAYQGFGTGLEEDTAAVRLFAEEGHEMLVAHSNSKNFGLYGERVGTLSVVTKNEEAKKSVRSQVKQMIRGMYSMPPLHGARIVAAILKSDELKLEWEHELTNMRERIQEMRKALVSGLIANGESEKFAFLSKQTGMFSYSGFNKEQVHRLREEYGIYMPNDGRINVAGLHTLNQEQVIDAILSV